MSRRKKNALFCLVSLISGCLLYILFRPTTYVGSMFAKVAFVDRIRQICLPYANGFCKFYLPDLLWGFSLGCGLLSLHSPGMKGVILCSACAFLFGTLWELLQHFKVFSGTGDIHDVIMYFFASAICIIINLKETKRE